MIDIATSFGGRNPSKGVLMGCCEVHKVYSHSDLQLKRSVMEGVTEKV